MSDTTKKKHYINRIEFHEELRRCKINDELSKAGLDYFMKLSNEVSKDYFYSKADDQKDAVARAIHDCYKYWKGFKENNVVQIKFIRNFVLGEKIVIYLPNFGEIRLRAGTFNRRNFGSDGIEALEFQIDETINKSLRNLCAVANEHMAKYPADGLKNRSILELFQDTVKKKLTIMDNLNFQNLEVKGKVRIYHADPDEDMMKMENEGDKWSPTLMKLDSKVHTLVKDSVIDVELSDPPNSFSYFTSVVRNGIVKALKVLYPKGYQQSNVVSIDGVNKDGDRMFNI